MKRTIATLILLATPALAGSLDRKAPPPMPKRSIISCLRLNVMGEIRCLPVDERIIREFGLRSGDHVTPRQMLQIRDEEQDYKARKLR